MSLQPDTRIPDLSEKIIVVRVGEGPHQEDFTVHENLARDSSDFFETALKPEWKPEDNVFRITECQPEEFSRYRDWLYNGHGPVQISTCNPEERKTCINQRIQDYILGEFLQDKDYQDTMIDCVLFWVDQRQPAIYEDLVVALVPRVFSDTTHRFALRRLAVDIAVWRSGNNGWHSLPYWRLRERHFPEEFVRPALIGLLERYQSRQPIQDPLEPLGRDCCYHFHGAMGCYKTRTISRGA